MGGEPHGLDFLFGAKQLEFLWLCQVWPQAYSAMREKPRENAHSLPLLFLFPEHQLLDCAWVFMLVMSQEQGEVLIHNFIFAARSTFIERTENVRPTSPERAGAKWRSVPRGDKLNSVPPIPACSWTQRAEQLGGGQSCGHSRSQPGPSPLQVRGTNVTPSLSHAIGKDGSWTVTHQGPCSAQGGDRKQSWCLGGHF